MRGAFIGFGNVALKAHLPTWRTFGDVRMVAATDPAPDRRDAFLASCPGGRFHDGIERLLSAETLDFVDICTPPASHVAAIGLALQAGLPVLCEKPLVTTLADARAIAATAERAGRAVHTVHNWLEAPVCRKVSALLAEGTIGPVRRIEWRTLRTEPAAGAAAAEGNWRLDRASAGGGILFDHGWHALSCILRWFAASPRGLSAVLEKRRHVQYPVEDTASLEIDFAAGRAQVFLTWAADERANRIELAGERGRIRVDGAEIVLDGPDGERRWTCPPPLSEGSYHPDWFAGIARDFLRAATDAASANLGDAVLCMRLIDLAQRSSDAGGTLLPLAGQA